MKRLIISIMLGFVSLSQALCQTNARILRHDVNVVVSSRKSYSQKEVLTVEICNEKGNDAANFLEATDETEKIVSFSGQIKDKDGRVIRKLKKKDLLTTELSEHMASDTKYTMFSFSPNSYPVTVTYEWEKSVTGGYMQYPYFAPQRSYDVEVVNASYRLAVPQNLSCRYFTKSSRLKVKESSADGMKIFTVEADSMAAVHKQPYIEEWEDVMPTVYFKPDDFVWLGHAGSSSSWQQFGSWLGALAEGRDVLPDEMKAKLHQLTDTCSTSLSKISMAYKLLNESTRYVSIQLGIGGMQPAEAKEVCHAGYGDCKGLSNFMRAMLKEIGIESYCAVISTYRRNIPKDFAMPGAFNHMILKVPQPNQDLWIECTNPQLPLGYVHSDIAGHEALVIKPDGGYVERLPMYADSLNRKSTVLNISLSPDAGAALNISQSMLCTQYEDDRWLLYRKEEQQAEYLSKEIALSSPVWSNVKIAEDKRFGNPPVLTVCAEAKVRKCARVAGTTMFVPIMPCDFYAPSLPSADKRRNDVHIFYGYIEEASVAYKLPDGYALDVAPCPIAIDKPFGSFSASVTIADGNVVIKEKIHIKSGDYKQVMYKEIVDFFTHLYDFNRHNLVLIKK